MFFLPLVAYMLILISPYSLLSWILILWRNQLFSCPCTLLPYIKYGMENFWIRGCFSLPAYTEDTWAGHWFHYFPNGDFACYGWSCAVGMTAHQCCLCAKKDYILSHSEFLLTAYVGLSLSRSAEEWAQWVSNQSFNWLQNEKSRYFSHLHF